jgi:serine/threonine protein kinase
MVGMTLEGVKDRKYVLKARLGSGSFASVWRAEIKETNECFAIKVFEIREALGSVEDAKRAYAREAAVLMDVRDAHCPHVVRIEENFEDEESGLCCIVMTLVEATSLQERV